MPESMARPIRASASCCGVFQTFAIGWLEPVPSPKVITPYAIRETIRPEFPRRVYCMNIPPGAIAHQTHNLGKKVQNQRRIRYAAVPSNTPSSRSCGSVLVGKSLGTIHRKAQQHRRCEARAFFQLAMVVDLIPPDIGRDIYPAVHCDCVRRSEEHTSELQSLRHLVCRL